MREGGSKERGREGGSKEEGREGGRGTVKEVIHISINIHVYPQS